MGGTVAAVADEAPPFVFGIMVWADYTSTLSWMPSFG